MIPKQIPFLFILVMKNINLDFLISQKDPQKKKLINFKLNYQMQNICEVKAKRKMQQGPIWMKMKENYGKKNNRKKINYKLIGNHIKKTHKKF